MWRVIIGIAIGIALFFPGIVLLQWLAVDVLGLYPNMTLTDGCLVYIIILQCVIIALQVSGARPSGRYPARLSMMGERPERDEGQWPRPAPREAPPRPRKRGYDR
jgi:hypothetical protein